MSLAFNFGGFMVRLVDAFNTQDTYTENGALTNSTTLDPHLDLFFISGACRQKNKKEIVCKLSSAFSVNSELATKIVFWAGDIRGGAGERRFFKIALEYIYDNYPEIFKNNLQNINYYNRWDSLFQFYNDDNVLNYVKNNIEHDGNLAKWMPREGKKNNQRFRQAFCEKFNLTPKKYRKLLVDNSKTVEQQLSDKKYNEVNYSQVPSVAFNKYRKSFNRNDQERFNNFIELVKNGESKINAGAIFPHDIYRSYNNGGDRESINAQWDSLPNFLENCKERILPVCDVSNSMTCMKGLPLAISISLGIYISERNQGLFKDVFMTFSENPQLNRLSGSVVDRFQQLTKADWGMNTNLYKSFQILLNIAVSNNITQSEMPTKLLIVSDMEFDVACRDKTNFESMKDLYEKHNYKMPEIIFWNVNSKGNNFPINKNDQGVALVSGASPSVIKSVLGGSVSPQQVMLDTVCSKRYDRVI